MEMRLLQVQVIVYWYYTTIKQYQFQGMTLLLVQVTDYAYNTITAIQDIRMVRYLKGKCITLTSSALCL